MHDTSARAHVLDNGLTLLMSPSATEPRIYTQIAVRAGSKHDPARSTGLAHYLEHMLFKGTDRLGSRDWAAEEPLLREIADLYEAHRAAPAGSRERRELYARIDAVSQEAARYAIPGEYDRIVARLGARNTNAYTWVDQTVFLNDIPAGELERWMHLEAERFSRLVLRLFHTELETVFEEFNITQDSDARKVMRVANEQLYAPHPYGTHTVIGRGEDLRAPSHHDIYAFFARHYVPGNMAVVLAGDFDPGEAIRLAEATFGRWVARPLPEELPAARPSANAEPDALAGTTRAYTVRGQESPTVHLHYRLPGATHAAYPVARLASGMLANRQAGLFDLALVRAQAVLGASSGLITMAEHTTLRCTIRPRAGQPLAAARDLALAQVARLAAGDYPDWLREAVVTDYELTEQRGRETNEHRARTLATAFVHGRSLADVERELDDLRTVTDADVRAFAKTYLAPESVVTVYKEQGEDPDVLRVEAPPITPVPLLTDDSSGFAARLLAVGSRPTRAEFADLERDVTQVPVASGVDLHHLANDENGLFELMRVYDFGTRDDRWIGLATKYLGYLGTGRRSVDEVQVDFYRLGLDWQVHATPHRTYVGVSGLDANLPAGLALLDELLADCHADPERWRSLADDTAERRRNARGDKQVVLRRGLAQYARHGAASALLTRPSLAELREADPEAVAARLRALADTRHGVFYYGPRSAREAAGILREARLPAGGVPLIPPAAAALPERLPTAADEVLFAHFPMVQAEVLLLRHVRPDFSPETWALGQWFNQYYGLGLSSVVFQELRESRALAYSTYAYAEAPARAADPHLLQAFIGTQPDKLAGALAALRGLLSDWTFDAAAAERVRDGMLEQMRSERDLRQSRYWLWRRGRDRGLVGNQRRWLYERLASATAQELRAFLDELAAAPTSTLVIGDRARVSLDALARYGRVRELGVGEVMGA